MDYTESIVMLIQILKLNEPRPWAMDGRTGVSHSAECVILKDDGSVDSVGVLKLRGETLVARAKPGYFAMTYTLRANPASRVIEAVVTDLQEVRMTDKGPVAFVAKVQA